MKLSLKSVAQSAYHKQLVHCEKSLSAHEELNMLYTELINEFTALAERVFASRYAKIIYLCKQVDDEFFTRVNRRLSALLAKQSLKASEVALAVNLLSYLINYREDDDYLPLEALFQTVNTAPPYKDYLSSKVIVSEVILPNTLICHASEQSFQLELVNYPYDDGVLDEARNFVSLAKHINPGMTLYLHNVEHADLVEDACYKTNKESYVIIEPDYLIDSTAIAECFQFCPATRQNKANYKLYFLALLTPPASSAAMFKGLLVNDILDELISKQGDFCLTELLKKHYLPCLGIAQGHINEIVADIKKNHLSTLLEFTKSMRGDDIIAEPAFYAPAYGLQGRLDILATRPDNPHNMDIIELKSGKPHRTHVWETNKYQVIAYNLLLDAVYSGYRYGASSILYSQAYASPVRNVSDSLIHKQRLLMLRNQIIFHILQIASGDISLFNTFNSQKFGILPAFKKDNLDTLWASFIQLDTVEKAYFKNYFSFAVKEQIHAKYGARHALAALWNESPEQKKQNFRLLDKLVYKSFDSRDGLVCLVPPSQTHCDFRLGDIVLIYPQACPNATSFSLCKAVIKEISSDRLVCKLFNRSFPDQFFAAYPYWVIEHDILDRGHNSLYKSLAAFISTPPAMRKLIMGRTKPSQLTYEYRDKSYLSNHQNKIIKKAMLASDYFLLQGPPGTGKTSTILKNIVCELQINNQHTCILTFTNKALEEVINNLKNYDYIILGSSIESPKSFYSLAKKHGPAKLKEIVGKGRIILATVASFILQKHYLDNLVTWNTLIVDEASQLLEPHLVGILPIFKKFIMIGDQMQLPAISLQGSQIITDTELQKINFLDYSESLFARLFRQCKLNEWPEAIATLHEHFRMHLDIAELVTPNYQHRLTAMLPRQSATLDLSSETLLAKRLVFIDSSPQQTKYHQQEATRCVQLVRMLINACPDFNINTLGIITPFKIQIAGLRTLLASHFPAQHLLIQVDTVERYQGSQKDIIILSLAVSRPHQLSGICSIDQNSGADRKLNVALSRARERLFILGDKHLLAKLNEYKLLISMIEKKGLYLDKKAAKNYFAEKD